MTDKSDKQRIPSVTTLTNLVCQTNRSSSRKQVTASAKEYLRDVRNRLSHEGKAGASVDRDALEKGFFEFLASQKNKEIRRVINATGIVLHTNLGRAPIAKEVMDRAVPLMSGYCNLEFDLSTGQRGKRASGVNDLLNVITGAEANVFVNNCAAACYLMLSAIAKGKEVIISRGELVQIGGGFRVPDILAESGATLREVGSTNITKIADYKSAINENTGLILKVHRSNFQILGHTEEASVKELADLGREFDIPMAMDLGSGAFHKWRGYDRDQEPTVQDVLRDGADLVCFSGDKLLGGPQAGFSVGRKDLVEKMRRHPLFRAMRPGKHVSVITQEILREYVANSGNIMSWNMIESADAARERAEEFSSSLPDSIPVEVVEVKGTVGGGAAPGKEFPTWAVRLNDPEGSVYRHFLQSETPIIPRVEHQAILIDLRTVPVDDEVLVREAFLTLP